jgi:regulator of protease activity HflC (stomatin/prohibitin superfamily)
MAELWTLGIVGLVLIGIGVVRVRIRDNTPPDEDTDRWDQ